MKEKPQEMLMSFPSDFKFLGAVDAAVQDLAREFAVSENSINDISTALIEACSNAIEHGNKFGKDKRVKVALGFNGGSITARVWDEGPGFDYEEILTRSAPPDPMSERGRGLIIMRAFTDELSFSYKKKEGLCVELVKSGGDPESDADAPTDD
ncbi:MAG: ATP-binding protein [Candidatus Latescibacterota bacterium]|jgi:serine/threonine-protein kinase RsbW